MNEIQNLKELLLKVSAISEKYKEIAEITGENYNVFNILGLSTREVRTHSAFIADLLNPKGLHGQGNEFLKLFIEQIKSKINFDFEDSAYKKNVRIKKEKYISEINKDNTEGGDIDILIEIENKAIIIENKIYAVDQKCQLVRYYNYGVSSYQKKGFVLIYLTLNEQEVSICSVDCNDKDCREKNNDNEKVKEIEIKPPKKTKLIKNKDFINITYKKDIISWLEKCLKVTECKLYFTEVLKQYINLIKQLTGQAMNDKMKNEITDIMINNPSNIESAFNIEESIFELKRKLTNKVTDELTNHFKEKGYKYEKINGFGINKYTHFIVYKENEKFGFGFGFDSNYWNNFFFGIVVIDKKSYNKDVFEKLKNISIDISTPYWPYNGYYKYRHWNKEVFIKIATGEFSKELIKKVEELEIIYQEAKESISNK